MKEIIIDTIIDSLKLIPFLFIAFLIIELIEHKLTKKSTSIIRNSKKFGPIVGSLFGAIPQCGFSVMATNLYITRIISLGTLLAIYLSTSDEMLPILISKKTNIKIIITIITIKIALGIIYGIIIDLFISKKSNKKTKEDYHICEEDHCHCEKGILTSSIKHTLSTTIYIFIITFIINIILNYFDGNILSKIFLKDSLFGPFITSLIGLIPNCASSVMLTELYLNSTINFASLISGLLAGSGTALLILFKSNKNIQENIKIILLLYFLGSISGFIINIISLILN